ncbi:MAG: YqgE/AlgH family protein [Hyphomicrobiaceae bacterium]
MKRSAMVADSPYLDGQLLIAMPSMTDRRFQRSVIFMCAHSSDGAMGLIINQRAKNIGFADLLSQLDLLPDESDESIEERLESMIVHIGGPVESGRGFVLHSSDYFIKEATLGIGNGMCLTATMDILRAIAAGKGPRQAMLALGYSGWAAGQLEGEIQSNGWLHGPSDPELVFELDLDQKYDQALLNIGVNPLHLVADSGHA